MSLDFVARIRTVAAVASVFLVGASGIGLAQLGELDASKAKKRELPKAERVSGVIVKAEKVADAKAAKGEGKSDRVLYRLSINSNAVWRDWARDQAQVRDDGTPKADAAKGANSIATQGEPIDPNSLVVIEVAAGTKVETRFRSPTDETSKGVASPDKVKTDEGTTPAPAPSGKAVRFRAEDLLPGLFVEVDYGPAGSGDENKAATVSVIRPIEAINTTPTPQPGSK